MKNLLLLLVFTSVTVVTYGQTSSAPIIAVVEHSNFLDQLHNMHSRESFNNYQTLLRPLFIKDSTGWKLFSTSPAYIDYFPIESAKSFIATQFRMPGIDDGQMAASQFSGLYNVESINLQLQKLPESERIFEHNDIIKYAIVSNKANVQRKVNLQPINVDGYGRKTILDSLRSFVIRYAHAENPGLEASSDKSYMNYYLAGVPVEKDSLVLRTMLQDSVQNKLVSLSIAASNLGRVFSITGEREDNGTTIELCAILRANRSVKFLFADTRLLEHADFDGDGIEEYIFFYSIFNHYGYMLVYDDFNKHVNYIWSYH